MASIAEIISHDQSPLAEFAGFLTALGERLEPTRQAYVTVCRSPAMEQTAQFLTELGRAVDRSPAITVLRQLEQVDLATLLTPVAHADAAADAVEQQDRWYRECVECAWGMS